MPNDDRCPLCGARLPPTAWLDACEELLDAELGVLAARCPACQGRLEIRPQDGRLELGYRNANGREFESARSLDFPQLKLTLLAQEMILALGERSWHFREA